MWFFVCSSFAGKSHAHSHCSTAHVSCQERWSSATWTQTSVGSLSDIVDCEGSANQMESSDAESELWEGLAFQNTIEKISPMSSANRRH